MNNMDRCIFTPKLCVDILTILWVTNGVLPRLMYPNPVSEICVFVQKLVVSALVFMSSFMLLEDLTQTSLVY